MDTSGPDSQPLITPRYRLAEKIGVGSAGVVYRAEDLELGRPVAIKILRVGLSEGDEAEARFQREAEALAAIDDRTIVRVLDRGQTTDGRHFLVMELLDGAPLDEILRRATAEAERAGGPEHLADTEWMRPLLGDSAQLDDSYLRQCVRWMARIAEGVASAHDAGVVHRDIKPSNIFIRADGSPVVLDFGVAARRADVTLAVRDGALGTPAYIAPELLDETGAISPAIDVYGVTATLYHLITLHPPFEGTPASVLAHIAKRDPRPATVYRPNLPREVIAVLETGMARKPRARYADARQLARDLVAFMTFQPLSVRPTPVPVRWGRRVTSTVQFRAFAVTLAVVAIALFVFTSLERWERERRESWQRAWSRVPPSLVIGSAETRGIADPTALGEVRARLDAAVAAWPDRVPSRLVRAAFLLDCGDRDRAMRDVDAIAEAVDTEYAHAFAETVRTSASPGTSSPPTAATAAPETDDDLVIDSFWRLRSAARTENSLRRCADALRGAADRGARFPAQLLPPVLLDVAGKLPRGSDPKPLVREAYECAIRTEEAIGRRTAATALGIGASLNALRRHDEAVDPLLEGIELAPSDHALRINLGVALHSIGAVREARAHFEAAIALRPNALGAHRCLTALLIDAGEFDAAETVLGRTPFPNDADGERSRAKQEARLGAARAYRALERNADAEAVAHAEHAVKRFAASLKSGDRHPYDMKLAAAIAHGRPEAAFAFFARASKRYPTNWRYIGNLASLMPDQPSPEETAALVDYLIALRNALAPEAAGHPQDTATVPRAHPATESSRPPGEPR